MARPIEATPELTAEEFAELCADLRKNQCSPEEMQRRQEGARRYLQKMKLRSLAPMEPKSEITLYEANAEGYIMECGKHGRYPVAKGECVGCPQCKAQQSSPTGANHAPVLPNSQ